MQELAQGLTESESYELWIFEAQRTEWEQEQQFPVWTCDRCLRDTVTHPDEILCDPCKEKSRRSTSGE